MKIYVDKYELVVIEHNDRFVVIDPHVDFEPDAEYPQPRLTPEAYVPYPDPEADGDVLVYASQEDYDVVA